MKFDRDNDTMTFSSGKTIDCYGAMIGLSPDMTVGGGYDEPIHFPPDHRDGGWLTPAEQIELADYMIGQWQQFRELAVQTPGPVKASPAPIGIVTDVIRSGGIDHVQVCWIDELPAIGARLFADPSITSRVPESKS